MKFFIVFLVLLSQNSYAKAPQDEWFPNAKEVHLNDTLTKMKFGLFIPGDVKLVGLHKLPYRQFAETILDSCYDVLGTVAPVASLIPLVNGFEFRIVTSREEEKEEEGNSHETQGMIILQLYNNKKWKADGAVNYKIRGEQIFHNCTWSEN